MSSFRTERPIVYSDRSPCNKEEDRNEGSDLAAWRRRIQNRIAQRKYRKNLKKRLAELEARSQVNACTDHEALGSISSSKPAQPSMTEVSEAAHGARIPPQETISSVRELSVEDEIVSHSPCRRASRIYGSIPASNSGDYEPLSCLNVDRGYHRTKTFDSNDLHVALIGVRTDSMIAQSIQDFLDSSDNNSHAIRNPSQGNLFRDAWNLARCAERQIQEAKAIIKTGIKTGSYCSKKDRDWGHIAEGKQEYSWNDLVASSPSYEDWSAWAAGDCLISSLRQEPQSTSSSPQYRQLQSASEIAKECGILSEVNGITEVPACHPIEPGDGHDIAKNLHVLYRSSREAQRLLVQRLRAGGDATTGKPGLAGSNVGLSGATSVFAVASSVHQVGVRLLGNTSLPCLMSGFVSKGNMLLRGIILFYLLSFLPTCAAAALPNQEELIQPNPTGPHGGINMWWHLTVLALSTIWTIVSFLAGPPEIWFGAAAVGWTFTYLFGAFGPTGQLEEAVSTCLGSMLFLALWFSHVKMTPDKRRLAAVGVTAVAGILDLIIANYGGGETSACTKIFGSQECPGYLWLAVAMFPPCLVLSAMGSWGIGSLPVLSQKAVRAPPGGNAEGVEAQELTDMSEDAAAQ